MRKILMFGLVLVAPAGVAAQGSVCRSLSDAEAQKLITEAGQVLVKGSGVECKAGETIIQSRWQIIDRIGGRYDCEFRDQGAKPFCWRLS